MDYKDTLLMPKTEFKMRGNLPENEKLQREKWEEMDLYNKIKEKNKGNTPFVLHDGPPYANGPIHIGHSLNKILKDFINRSKMMEGYYVDYVPGWDTHGLPIEQKVTESGINRKEISIAEFREHCKEFALKQVDIQREDFKRLNVIGEWDNPEKKFQKIYRLTDQGKDNFEKKKAILKPRIEESLKVFKIIYKDIY